MGSSDTFSAEMSFARRSECRKLPPREVALLEEWLLGLAVAGRSPATLQVYRRHIGQLTRWLSARDRTLLSATATDLREYLADMARRGLSPDTLRSAYSYIHALYAWLVREGELLASPLQGIPRPRSPERVVRALSPDDVRRLLQACGKGAMGARDQALVLVLYDTGLRANELLSMRIDAAGRYELVIVMGKGGAERAVRLGLRARQAVLRYVRLWRPRGPWLWESARRQRLSYEGLREILRALGERAGLPGLRPHMMRHSFAQALLAETGDWDAVRVLGGWRSSQVMLRYLRGREMERALEVHRRFSPADRL